MKDKLTQVEVENVSNKDIEVWWVPTYDLDGREVSVNDLLRVDDYVTEWKVLRKFITLRTSDVCEGWKIKDLS